MGKYDEIKGFIRGISDEEFEILLNLGFTKIGFKVEKIRRSIQVTNDFLLDLTRTEKRFLRGEKKFVYVAYVDRKQHEYSNEWVSNFWLRANTYDTYQRTIKKIFIMDMNKIPKIKLRKDLKRNINFKIGNKFFDFLFTAPPENVSFLESLYRDESQIWDKKTPEQQKDFCEKVGADYTRYARLWKYPIDQQSKLIFSLRNGTGRKEKQEQKRREEQQRREEQRTYSDSDLKKYYDILDLPETASSEEIKFAYRESIKFYHTDKFENKPPEDKARAERHAKKINDAYDELKKAGKVN